MANASLQNLALDMETIYELQDPVSKTVFSTKAP